jgi:hypothetical protein
VAAKTAAVEPKLAPAKTVPAVKKSAPAAQTKLNPQASWPFPTGSKP